VIAVRVQINHSRCTGLGICESMAEDVFEVTDDGTVRLLAEDISPDRRDEIQAAVDACPTEALQLVD
jgi:ferredoxin